MQVYCSPHHQRHHALEMDGGVLIPSWESPRRAEMVYNALRDDHEVRSLASIDWGVVERIHDKGYLTFLATAWDRWKDAGQSGPAAMGSVWPTRRLKQNVVPNELIAQLGYYSFATDCSIVAGTWEAVQTSVALAQAATGAVIGGERAAFGLCRPPGHHATTDQFGGYCYINNAAVAAQQLLESGSTRVAIVDVDYHHGNGTQDIFYDRSDVLYCSIHGDPAAEFPYFLGFANEVGTGEGEGFNHNEPLPLGSAFDTWSAALDRCMERVAETDCDALVISLGVDTYELDPISSFKLTRAQYPAIGERLAEAGLPTVLLFEGGYAVEDVGTNVAGVLQGFENNGC